MILVQAQRRDVQAGEPAHRLLGAWIIDAPRTDAPVDLGPRSAHELHLFHHNADVGEALPVSHRRVLVGAAPEREGRPLGALIRTFLNDGLEGAGYRHLHKQFSFLLSSFFSSNLPLNN